MLPDRVSNPGPLNYESGVLPIALHGPAESVNIKLKDRNRHWRLRCCMDNLANSCTELCQGWEDGYMGW